MFTVGRDGRNLLAILSLGCIVAIVGLMVYRFGFDPLVAAISLFTVYLVVQTLLMVRKGPVPSVDRSRLVVTLFVMLISGIASFVAIRLLL